MILRKIIYGFRKGLKVTLIGMVIGLALHTVTVPIAYFTNRSIESFPRTVVFTSDYEESLSKFAEYIEEKFNVSKKINKCALVIEKNVPSGFVSGLEDFFMYPSVTLRQNFNGNKVKWVSNANKRKILEEIAKPEINNVVFIGHGGKTYYCASDKIIYDFHIEEYVREEGIKKKPGELVQYTCGNGEGKSLRDILLKDPTKGYSSKGITNPFTSYVRGWYEYFRSTY